jgi:cytidine deaminase
MLRALEPLCYPGDAAQKTMNNLGEIAVAAREHAFAPFSKFRVGAALEDSLGRIHTGCNVENATYGLTICAERVAIFKAISEGARQFIRIAIAADTDQLTPPCGACRQILWEFCGEIEVLLVNPRGASESMRLKDLFPRPFDANFL